jgi:hypothetical protein
MPDQVGPDAGSEDSSSVAPTGQQASQGIPWRNAAWVTAIAALLAVFVPVVLALIDRQGEPNGPPVPAPTAAPKPTTPAPSEPAQGSGSSGATVVADDSLEVTISLDPGDDPRSGESYVFPAGSITAASWPNQMTSIRDFSLANGGVAAGEQAVELIIRTRSEEPVLITKIAPRVVAQRTPRQADYLVKHPYGCGVAVVRHAVFDFDVRPPSAGYVTGEDTLETPKDSLLLEVTPQDPEVVTVLARATQSETRWELLLTYNVGGQTRKLAIRPDAQPFTVTGVPSDTPTYVYSSLRALEPSPFGPEDPTTWC